MLDSIDLLHCMTALHRLYFIILHFIALLCITLICIVGPIALHFICIVIRDVARKTFCGLSFERERMSVDFGRIFAF